MNLLFSATAYILNAFDMPQLHYQKVSLRAVCSCVCSEALSGRAVLVHRWDHREKPQTRANENAVQELFTVYSCKMVISRQFEVFWGVGLMCSAWVLKYEIDSLGSCKGRRHFEKEAAYLHRQRNCYSAYTWARQFFAQKGLETRKGSSPVNVWRGDTKNKSETGTGWLWGDWETYKKKEVNCVKAEREDGFGHHQVSQNSIIRNMGEVNEQWLPGKQFTPSCQVFKSFMCCRLIASYLLSLWIKPQASWGDVLPCPWQTPTVRQLNSAHQYGLSQLSFSVNASLKEIISYGFPGFLSVPFALS